MASFFHGMPEIQSDGLHTLYLMNPSYADEFSNTAAAAAEQQPNIVFLNSGNHHLHHHHQQQQHFVAGNPLQSPAAPPPVLHSVCHHEISPEQNLVPRLNYDLWNSQNMAAMPTPAIQQQQQGLSLSLSPHQAQYHHYRRTLELRPEESPADISPAVVSVASNGSSAMTISSKYLKVAQQLLDELVKLCAGEIPPAKATREPAAGEVSCGKKTAGDLPMSEKQDLQMKKAKLVSMLDEVEQRYRRYKNQVQIVAYSLETVAGAGSSATYTAVAVQTISRKFRCLRDAISGQITAAVRSLGEEVEEDEEAEEGSMVGNKSINGGGRSSFRFVDHQMRQQRALHQLGMINHNTWRPQRGLPERSVSILRAWLFEHFLHPYPKDSDKMILAKQTGLTRNQVSNWFINARVRLWKPMVEEMYLEETKGKEQQSKGSAIADEGSSAARRSEISSTIERDQAFSGETAMMQGKLKKGRSDGGDVGDYALFSGGGGEFGQFAARFAGNGGVVSLTLGLPHSDVVLPLSGAGQPSFLGSEDVPLGRRTMEVGGGAINAFESIDIQSRKRLAAAQLLLHQ